MPNKWIMALKQYNNEKGGSWCVPRKGSPDYDRVRAIMDGKEAPIVKQEVKAQPKAEVKAKPAGYDSLTISEKEKLFNPLKALGHFFWRRVGGGDVKPSQIQKSGDMTNLFYKKSGSTLKAYFNDDKYPEDGLENFPNNLVIRYQGKFVKILPDYIVGQVPKSAKLSNYSSDSDDPERQLEDLGGSLMNLTKDKLKDVGMSIQPQ